MLSWFARSSMLVASSPNSCPSLRSGSAEGCLSSGKPWFCFGRAAWRCFKQPRSFSNRCKQGFQTWLFRKLRPPLTLPQLWWWWIFYLELLCRPRTWLVQLVVEQFASTQWLWWILVRKSIERLKRRQAKCWNASNDCPKSSLSLKKSFLSKSKVPEHCIKLRQIWELHWQPMARLSRRNSCQDFCRWSAN